ncbi:MAG: hypothetical protein ACJ77G_09445 [Solirubrobacteraceae bacterium]
MRARWRSACADVYGRLGAYPDLAAAVAGNQVLLGAMTQDELVRAVRQPARLAGLKLEAGLVELILRDVASEPGALPLLSHAMRATWERRDGRTLTVEGYRASGGVAAAIGRTADAILDGLPPEQATVARSVFLRLTELGEGAADSRRRVPSAELVPEHASPEGVEALLERLSEARLVTLDDGSAEVAHEALIREWPRLRGWLEDDRAGLRAHRRLGDAAHVWDAGGRERSDLYRGARLAGAVDLVHGGGAELNAVERAFLDASVEESQRERRAERRANRRLRGLLAGAAVLLAVAIGAGVLSVNQRNRAESQALRSDAERIGALAQTAPGLEQSMLYGAAAVALEDSVQTRGELLAALQRQPAAVRVLRPTSAIVSALALSPDGRLLASGDSAGVVSFTDVKTWQRAGAPVRLPSFVAPQAIRFSPDSTTLAVATRHGTRSELHVVDVATREARRIGSWRGLGPQQVSDPTTAIAYAPGGRRLAVSVVERASASSAETPTAERLLLLDADTGRRVWERKYPLRPAQEAPQLLFRPDGALITSAVKGETLVWDAREGRIVRRYPIGGRFDVSPDGRRLAVTLNNFRQGLGDSKIALLDLRSGRHTVLLERVAWEWLVSLTFTADGTRVIGEGPEGAHVWDLRSGRITETYGVPKSQPWAEHVLDRRGLVMDVRSDGAISVWDADGAHRSGRRFAWSREGGCGGNPCTVVDPRGAVIATSNGDGTIALVDLRTKRRIARLPARDGTFAEAIAFMAGGRQLVTGGSAGSVTIRDVGSQAIVRRLRFPDRVAAVAVSPDDRLLAVELQADGASSARVELLDLRSSSPVRTHQLPYAGVQGPEGPHDLAFTGDGRLLVALGCCSGGSTVLAWDTRTGAKRLEVRDRRRPHTMALAPGSRLMAVGMESGDVTWWDLDTGRPRGPATRMAGGGIYQLAVSPDRRLLAVGALDQTATVWDIRTRKRLGGAFPTEKFFLPNVAFEPSGRLLVTELGDALEWPLDRASLQRFACQVAGRSLTREEWAAVLPNQPYRRVCR